MYRSLAVASTLALLGACGPKVEPTTDFGPPPQPIDPIACPATTLERFAASADMPATISTEPVVDAAGVDRVPCRPDEADAACLARARQRPVPSYYEVSSVEIAGDVSHVEFTYDLDGRRITEQAESMEAMVSRLKALQARGHKVVVIRGESASDAGSRHAAIAYRGVGGQQRRIVTLRARPADPARAMAEVQAAAERERIQLRSMEQTGDGELVVVATCGPL